MIAALIVQGIGPGGSVKFLLTGGLDIGTAPAVMSQSSPLFIVNIGKLMNR